MTELDWLLVAAAAFVAVTALVRLMRARRDEMVQQLRQQVRDKPKK